MARPKKDSSQPDTRTRILQAARIEFASQGLGAPLDQIAQRCGIRRPSLLHHFASKELLIEALLEDVVRSTQVELARVVQAHPTPESASFGVLGADSKLKALFRVLRSVEEKERGVAGVLMHLLLQSESRPTVLDKLSSFLLLVERTLIEIDPQLATRQAEVKAVVAHLVIAETMRVALGQDADGLWGQADGLAILFDCYFSGS